MRNHRLHRLSVLTKGTALVGFGLASLACGDPPHVNAPPPEPPQVNAPPDTTPIATGSTAPAAAPEPITPPSTIHAPPMTTASAAPSATPAPTTSEKKLGKPPVPNPVHMNAPRSKPTP